MAKANHRFQGNNIRSHAKEGEYKIPLKDRKKFRGSNKNKWVDKNIWKKYQRWKKNGGSA